MNIIDITLHFTFKHFYARASIFLISPEMEAETFFNIFLTFTRINGLKRSPLFVIKKFDLCYQRLL